MSNIINAEVDVITMELKLMGYVIVIVDMEEIDVNTQEPIDVITMEIQRLMRQLSISDCDGGGIW